MDVSLCTFGAFFDLIFEVFGGSLDTNISCDVVT